ncbi:hypothetical protein HDV03_001067 [Kappamyces sp. JEL0829]|nr:hypothetical protein HDV03_001067 [Kappamyces sp. JEL0829]
MSSTANAVFLAQKYIKKLSWKQTYIPRELNDRRNELETLLNFQKRQKNGFKPPTERKPDIINAFGLDLKREYKNVDLLSSFCNKMGGILPRTETSLTRANQKQVARAIRRARSMGFLAFQYRV